MSLNFGPECRKITSNQAGSLVAYGFRSQHPFAAMSAIFSSRYTEQTHTKRKYATTNEQLYQK
jgi:hypothetical protein